MRGSRHIFTAVALLTALMGCSRGEAPQQISASSDGGEALSGEAAIRETYLRSCHSCHGSGVGGAPRTGDVDAWSPRLAKGMDTLVSNAINGYQAMPPRGLCFDCSEAQFAGLIRYMASTRED